MSIKRQLDACTAPDDPNVPTASGAVNATFCDDRNNNVPYRKGFKLSASMPVVCGVTLSAVFQSNHGIAARNNATGGEVMAVTRNSTRYPATCPAPCPAGQISMPSGIFGQGSMTVNLVDGDTSERINQLDFRAAKTFRVQGSITPSAEVFNLNNTDAVITYASTNVLSQSHLRPNSIMQGARARRMVGGNVPTRW